MSGARGLSLKWRLVWRLVTLQAAIFTAAVLLFWGAMAWAGSGFDLDQEETVMDTLQHSLARDAVGGLTLVSTPALMKLQSDFPDIWFLIRDRDGHALSRGAVPPEFAHVGQALDHISQARLGWSFGDPPRPSARVKRIDTPVGNVQVITGPPPRVPPRTLFWPILLVTGTVIVPALVPMALATLVATPLVVRNALRGLGEVVGEAGRIDIDRRGVRLSLANVPTEVRPLVTAVNGALTRLDEGYERHRRFLADAAHELRTPIAILQARIESLPRDAGQVRLSEDAARLAVLAEQLLDLQRLKQRADTLAPIDLRSVAERVVADLAPLAIAGGYEMSLEASQDPVMVMGDRSALERALANLVQNAITHGGRRGTITVGVEAAGAMTVLDEGEGIPPADRERVFEPFHRRRPLDRGAGLGLNLVREVVGLHSGHVSIVDAASTSSVARPSGACVRMVFPLLPSSA